jgi:hypothetical protein
MMNAVVLGRSGDWADFLISFFPLWILIGFGVYLAYQVSRSFSKPTSPAKGETTASYTTDEVVCDEDPADIPADLTIASSEDDREAARKWWAEGPPPVLDLVVVGATVLELEGKGVAAIDDFAEAVDGEKKIEPAGKEVAVKLEGKVRVTFAAGGSASFAEGGELKIEGPGGFRVASNSGLTIDGSGKAFVERFAEVSVRSAAGGLIVEVRKCKTVFSGDAREMFAYDCEVVYVGDQCHALATRCKQVSAQDRSRVFAVECAVVRAMGKSKVKCRQCPDVHRSDEAVLEPVL